MIGILSRSSSLCLIFLRRGWEKYNGGHRPGAFLYCIAFHFSIASSCGTSKVVHTSVMDSQTTLGGFIYIWSRDILGNLSTSPQSRTFTLIDPLSPDCFMWKHERRICHFGNQSRKISRDLWPPLSKLMSNAIRWPTTHGYLSPQPATTWQGRQYQKPR